MARDTAAAPVPSGIAPLTVHTLGRFSVCRGSDQIEDGAWKRRKAKSLLKLLILAPNRQTLKDYVLDLLWPDQDPDSAANNFHRTLFVLRHTLQPDLSDTASSHYVVVERGTISLNPAVAVWTDFEEFERLIRVGRQEADPLRTYEAARALYQGDFLPEDLYEDWAAGRRETLHTSYCELLRGMARLYGQRADFAEALDCLQALIRVDPTNESGHRELMRVLTLTGHRHQALHQYQRAREILRRELDAEPSPETTDLYRAIVENRWRPPVETRDSRRAAMSSPILENRRRLPLIGREMEVRRLKEMVHQVATGQSCVAFLCGEQGVGKSRLAEEITAYADGSGMHVLYGAAYEQEGRLPYGPFVEAIRSGLAAGPRHFINEMLGMAVNDLARLLPELASPELGRLLPELASRKPAARQSPELDIGQERQRLFDAVVAVFTALSQESPLVVFLDDLHAADESSLQLLHYLARRLSDAPIFFLCALREEEVPRGTSMARLFGELLRSPLCRRVDLSRLSPADTARLAANLLDGGELAPELADAVYQLTEGNSFFVQEVMLALLKADTLERAGDVWRLSPGQELFVPASVREVIGLRLETLSREANRFAALASVVGREFGYDLLRAAAQQDDPSLLDLVDELLEARLIEETSNGYRFCHTLIRQAVYDGLSARRRLWLHDQVAQALEHLAAHHLDERAAILAYHYERAERYLAALAFLIRAGDRARATNAPREAVDQYDRALALCRQHQELATAETLSALYERRAQAYLALSSFDSAIGDLEQLLESSRRAGDRPREGEALYQVGIAHYWAHRLQPAAAYLDQAIQLAEKLHDDALGTKALKLLDILNSTKGGPARASSVKAVGTSGADRATPAEEHWGLALLAYLRSDFEIAIQHARACVTMGESFPNPFLVLGGCFVESMSRASLGQYQAALGHLLPALDMSEAAGDRFWRARLLNTAGWIYRELFEVRRAIHYDESSLELARTGTPRLTEAEGNALANLANDALLLGDFGRARSYLEEGTRGVNDEQFMRWRYGMRMTVTKGRLELAEGNLDGALAAAEEVLAIARTTQAYKNIVQSCRLRGETLLARGETGLAGSVLRRALATSLKIKSPALIWPSCLCLARVEEAQGKPEKALAQYRGAAEVLQQIASDLTDPVLRGSFLSAPEVQQALGRAGQQM